MKTRTCVHRRRVVVLCVASVIAILLLAPAVGEANGPARHEPTPQALSGQMSKDWRMVQSANFVVFGNATRDDLRRAVVELEAFRAMLLQLFPSLRLTSPVPIRVIVFRDAASFSRFRPRDARGKPEEWVGGYFAQQPDVNYLVVAGGATGLQLSIVFHEYTHYVLHRNLPGLGIRRTSTEELEAAEMQSMLQAEAHTYIGFDLAMAGKRDEAIVHFKWVKKQGSQNYVEYPMAVAELKRLEDTSGAPQEFIETPSSSRRPSRTVSGSAPMDGVDVAAIPPTVILMVAGAAINPSRSVPSARDSRSCPCRARECCPPE